MLLSNAMPVWPKTRRMAPKVTAFLEPRILSANMPPKTGMIYTKDV